MSIDDLKHRSLPEMSPNTALFGSGQTAASISDNWRELFPEIIGRSESMQHVLQVVAKSARSDCSVLIHGESGTGKELIASALHRLSNRSSKRFVAINCSAIPENLLESELFGHEKGAFTGATGRKAGYFEMANQGTLFLDEIGDMPARLQAKLLRVLQEKQYTPVGGHSLKKADVRIIAATNIDLEHAVKESRFRLDLFYRLNVLPIKLPSLKERKPDVVSLLDHFLECTNRTHDVANPCYFSGDALKLLSDYQWPGNVRELQNVVERLVIFVRNGEIGLNSLPDEIKNQDRNVSRGRESLTLQRPATETSSEFRPQHDHTSAFGSDFNLNRYIEDLENSLIKEALQKTQNNKQRAAKLLGLNRTTLVERIKKRNIKAG
ncbi:sigma-54 dependent transcriptional regulator [Oligoflexaceae bacterium]|nr:sigma-54 dependent transcriptional regulator [Oligoflexaceae bacterium]